VPGFRAAAGHVSAGCDVRIIVTGGAVIDFTPPAIPADKVFLI
jgi:hypothetical protein